MSMYTRGEGSSSSVKQVANLNVTHVAIDPWITRVAALIADNHLLKAIDVLRTAGSGPSVKNSLAVCLMRSGQVDEAVKTLRSMTLNPGSTWERADVPDLYKRNFATALLLAGLPSGCVSVLRSVDDQWHPRVAEIQRDIQAWVKSLSVWKRWDWKLNQVDPRGASIKLSFVPGEFDFTLPEAIAIDSPTSP